jgi:hypothetical protein
VEPAQEGQAKRAPAGAADLLVKVRLFAAEAAPARVEARPRRAPAGEQPQPLHRDFKRLAARLLPALVVLPRPEHPGAPDGAEVLDEA